jgi:hypothetical protein
MLRLLPASSYTISHVVKCLCRKCQNFAFLLKNDIKIHHCKNGFMPNYLVWCEHREVEPTAESDRTEDKEQMDEMIAEISREYDPNSDEQPPPPEVQKLCSLLATSDKKST